MFFTALCGCKIASFSCWQKATKETLKMRNILLNCFGFFHDSEHTNIPFANNQEQCLRFSLAQLKKWTNNFGESRAIRIEAGFTTFYKGCIIINGENKEIAVERLLGKRKYEWKNVVETLSQLRHPNLTFLIGFCDDKDEMLLVYEYISNGSLYDHLHRADKYETLSWKKRLEICIGVARGLQYLHKGTRLCIIHRDVKPSNIRLDENWQPKLVDFHISVTQPISASGHADPAVVDYVAGTYGYIAPEQLIRSEVSDKTDVFSFGMVLMELLSAKTPATILKIGTTMEEEMREYENIEVDEEDDDTGCYVSVEHNLANKVCKFVQEGRADEIIDPFLMGKIAPECWKLFINVAERCLLQEPAERPTMAEVEAELERVLQLQEEADLVNSGNEGDYSLN